MLNNQGLEFSPFKRLFFLKQMTIDELKSELKWQSRNLYLQFKATKALKIITF